MFEAKILCFTFCSTCYKMLSVQVMFYNAKRAEASLLKMFNKEFEHSF